MKNVQALHYGSPAVSLLALREENQKKIAFAKKAIGEIEEFLEQFKKYLAVLEKVKTVLDSENIE